MGDFMNRLSKNMLKKGLLLLLILSTGVSSIEAGFIPLFKKRHSTVQKEDSTPVDRLPIVYHQSYDISMFGIEKIHPFDSTKYGKVYNALCKKLQLDERYFYAPEQQIADKDLLLVHGQAYLDSLYSSSVIERIAGVPLLRLVPNFLLQRCILKPMRYATAGTLLATDLAIKHGWAINLSGGYHHAKTDKGDGFCVFGDIQLTTKKVLEQHPDWKILIVDLDAHQGNGYAEGLRDESRAFIFDMYSSFNYPHDTEQMERINYNFPVPLKTDDKEYLEILKTNLPIAIKEVNPNLIIYNAGTDIYASDPIGRLSVSREGVILRDQSVFGLAEDNQIPIVMLLSGGYTKESAGIIADSIEKIIKTKKSEIC
jgi:histone deacetylase 11